jgi:protease-4
LVHSKAGELRNLLDFDRPAQAVYNFRKPALILGKGSLWTLSRIIILATRYHQNSRSRSPFPPRPVQQYPDNPRNEAGGRFSGALFTEEVIREGPRMTKIAVIRLQGVINDEQAHDMCKQLKRAREDRRIKGIILRVNSPGGTISGSDQIYDEIKEKTDKPVVAFMQSVAASGGYYVSVGCDKIVGEPTVITGSIGVIGGYLVLEKLLEEKLAIRPIIVKSGEKKDWPSSFRDPNDVEIQYLRDKLITPAYKRFLQVVAEGRESVLTPDEVEQLADGSIYWAQEALDEKLIDKIGYLDEAIEQVKLLAGIEKAQVVEYRKPFSFAEFLTSQSGETLKIDKTTLYELCTPQVLYLWTVRE